MGMEVWKNSENVHPCKKYVLCILQLVGDDGDDDQDDDDIVIDDDMLDRELQAMDEVRKMYSKHA